jgi:hypothetical protein
MPMVIDAAAVSRVLAAGLSALAAMLLAIAATGFTLARSSARRRR